MSTWICKIPFLKNSHNLHKFPIFTHNISLLSFSTSSRKILVFNYLVNNHHFSPECAAKVSSSSSSTKYLNKPQNVDSILNFLKDIGFDKNHIEDIVKKAPGFLFADLERTIKPKFKVFQDLGFCSTVFAHLIAASPSVLYVSPDKLRLSVLGLQNVLGPNADVTSLLTNYGFARFLKHGLESEFVPNMEYLKSCGVCSLQIAYVCRHPLFFLSNPEKFKVSVHRVDEMGVDRKSKMFIEGVRMMCSYTKEKWELKLDVFRELGFTEQNILVAFRRMPQAFGVSEKKIKEVIPLLLNFEDVSYIARNPALLAFSVEKRLKPRLRVIKALQGKNLLRKKPALAHFSCISDAKFVKTFVSPYSNEVGGLYAVSQGSNKNV